MTDIVRRLEEWIASRLAAVEVDGVKVFRTAEVHKHQIQGADWQGVFDRLAPFAFVGWVPRDPVREGGYEAAGVIRIAVEIGTVSTTLEGARVGAPEVVGSVLRMGASRLRELVFDAIEDEHPDEGEDEPTFPIDRLVWVDEYAILDSPKRFAFGMTFQTRQRQME